MYIFDINGWVGDYVVELIIVKENFPVIDYIIMHYFENNSVGNGVSYSSLVKQIQKKVWHSRPSERPIRNSISIFMGERCRTA